MHRTHPLFDPMPPGYSGPQPGQSKKPPNKPRPAQVNIEGEEPIPFDVDRPPMTQGGQGAGSGGYAPRTVAISDASQKIRTFEQRLGGKHEDEWSRKPNTTGMGAIHVKSFHCKLTGDSLTFIDRQINEWLDEHPEYEVKLVTTSIGTWTGKLKEPNLIVNVWV